MCPAIHITSRSWLRSSSTHEPSDPPLRVVSVTFADALRPQRPALTVHRQYIGHEKNGTRGDGLPCEAGSSLNRRKRAEKRPPPEALPVRQRDGGTGQVPRRAATG
jgi:hypothetical protein